MVIVVYLILQSKTIISTSEHQIPITTFQVQEKAISQKKNVHVQSNQFLQCWEVL